MAGSVSGTQAVDRAAALVGLVVRAESPLSFTELSDAADLARSTTSRLLAALERSQLLERDADGNYLPGSLFALYATRTDPQAELIRHAHPALEHIRDVTGETANLGMAQGDTVMHVDQADSRYLLGTQDWTQIVVPAHVSALGRALQAWDALPLPTGPMERLTAATLTEPRQLARELAQVRRRGYAVTVDELELGLTGLAAPIDGPRGVVAALGVSGPTARLKSRVSQVGRLLVEQADIVSSLLRRHAPTEGAA